MSRKWQKANKWQTNDKKSLGEGRRRKGGRERKRKRKRGGAVDCEREKGWRWYLSLSFIAVTHTLLHVDLDFCIPKMYHPSPTTTPSTTTMKMTTTTKSNYASNNNYNS